MIKAKVFVDTEALFRTREDGSLASHGYQIKVLARVPQPGQAEDEGWQVVGADAIGGKLNLKGEPYRRQIAEIEMIEPGDAVDAADLITRTARRAGHLPDGMKVALVPDDGPKDGTGKPRTDGSPIDLTPVSGKGEMP